MRWPTKIHQCHLLQPVVKNEDVPEVGTNENDDTSVNQSTSAGIPNKTAGKKRKSSKGIVDDLFNLLGSFCQKTDDRLSEIVTQIGYEYDVASQQKKVYDMLSTTPGLSMDDKIDISMALVKNVEYLEMFTGLPDDARPAFVRRLLGRML